MARESALNWLRHLHCGPGLLCSMSGLRIDMLSFDDIVHVIRLFRENGASVLLITHRPELALIAILHLSSAAAVLLLPALLRK